VEQEIISNSDQHPDGVREDFWWVYQRLGGRRALHSWAEDNAKEFFKMFFSLLPKRSDTNGTAAELVNALRELAAEDDG
jgi:hypothetical protein